MRTSSRKESTKSWIWVVLFSIIILLSVPLARNIQSFATKHLGKNFFIYFISGVIILFFIILLYFLARKLRASSPWSYIWLTVITSLYLFFTLKLQKNPPEALHFLEYGILSFLLFRALKYDTRDRSIYFSATLFCLLIGNLDEILQWMLPRRFWDFQDVGLNALSGGLFQLSIWKVIKPKFISAKFSKKSLRFFSFIFAICLIILGLCASNTPERVAVYSDKMPFLAFLQKEEPMGEFGYEFKDAEIGKFKSRMSPSELDNTDRIKADQYAQIMNQSAKTKYDQFIIEYTPITNPFLYELRIHIFRRDNYLKKGKNATDKNEKREAYFIAYKENLILEKYFGNTLIKTTYAWDEYKKKEVEAWIDKNKPYKSPVSANIINSFSEKTMWTGILLVIVLLVGINFFFYIKEKREKVTVA